MSEPTDSGVWEARPLARGQRGFHPGRRMNVKESVLATRAKDGDREAFGELVKHGGWLDEVQLPLRTFGWYKDFPSLIRMIPVGLRALRRGKMPPIFHKAIPGAEEVRRVFEKVEGEK